MGKAPADSFLVVHRFMWGRLGLSGTTLLVFARIYGFCSGGGEFYESKPNTAAFLGISERMLASIYFSPFSPTCLHRFHQ